jgi:uncharacterized glyoxalase superfamily protein PhnB
MKYSLILRLMKLQSITPNLMVKDVTKSVEYYTQTLGFNLFMWVDFDKQADFDGIHDGVEYAFAILKSWDYELMLQSEKSLADDLPFLNKWYTDSSVALYIKIENIDEYYKQIKDKVKIVKDIETTWYGMKEFYIKDLNGYILGFAEMNE